MYTATETDPCCQATAATGYHWDAIEGVFFLSASAERGGSRSQAGEIRAITTLRTTTYHAHSCCAHRTAHPNALTMIMLLGPEVLVTDGRQHLSGPRRLLPTSLATTVTASTLG